MKKKGMKRILAYVLALCMMVSGMLTADYSTAYAQEENTHETDSTTVYFYNSDAYASVIAHAWSDSESGVVNLTGGWGETRAEEADLGEGWMKAQFLQPPVLD